MVPTLTAPVSPAAPPGADGPALPPYCYPKQYAQLLSEVADHQLTVLHSDGLYRHLRFAAPGTRIWSFDLITWPGYLTIVGDIGGGHTFTRVPDMLRFFDENQPAGHINVDYWSEKLVGGRRSVRTFSEDRFAEHVNARVAELAEHLPEADAERLRQEVGTDVLGSAWDEHDAVDALTSFEFDGRRLDDEPSERSWTDYDHHFLIALHAILWGAKKYHAHLAATGS